ncbi:MAG: hypothetical protein E7599_07210 [Ruminococcaceae bacterium]|nr:hypothetical protein [Oscillospiraceae bacterium]
MKQNKQYAINRLFFFFIIIGILLGVTTVPMAMEELSLGIIMGIMAACTLITPFILMPTYYAFDKEGVTLCYLLLPSERYLWKNVTAVTVHIDPKSMGLANFFLLEGTSEGTRRFYMDSHIRKSGRTKRLLEKYWHKKIGGYYFAELKSKSKRRLEKEELATKAHLTDEIVQTERNARAEARRVLQPLSVKAEELGLSLNYEFLFLTSDLELHKRRPTSDYDYTAAIELSLPEESDEARILCLDARLLQVHLTKKAYQGTEIENALVQMEDELEKAFTKIRKYGFEQYLTRH